MTKPVSPFRYFNSPSEVIRLVVVMYVRYPLSLRNVEDLLHERGIDLSYETVRYWWNRFGPMFAAEHCQSKFYTGLSAYRGKSGTTVLAEESPLRPARFDAENQLYSVTLTVPTGAMA
jgi:hypothetical protein